MKVGFIGLGNMGNPMAANILKARHDLTVYDVRREMGRNLEDAGAKWAVSPKDIAAQSEVVLSSLPGPREVEAVVLGEEGLFAGLNRGSAYIDTSTNAPTTMCRIAEIGTSRGFHVLDAPISGGVFARGTQRSPYLSVEKRKILSAFDHCCKASARMLSTWDRLVVET